MCGIIGFTGTLEAKQVVLDGLCELEYRGYDSAGMAYFAEDQVEDIKAVGRVAALNEAASELKTASHTAIGHTRWATHGEANLRNCHPHAFAKVSLIHNGIIENYREIASMLESEEIYPQSETDTEIAALLIGSRYRGNPLRTLRNCLPLFDGSYAFCILFHDRPGEIYVARMGSPLVVSQFAEGSIVSSDILATIAYSKKYFPMPEQSIACLSANSVELYDYKGRSLVAEWEEVHWDIEGAKKQGYEYYMQKEIHEEPEALKNTIRPRLQHGLPDLSVDNIPDSLFTSIDRIIISACGTAMHASLVGRVWFESYLRLPLSVEIASEFRYAKPIIDKRTLVIIISQSGETADSLAALNLAKSLGCPTLAVVNVKGSAIARTADYVFYTHAGPEIAVASTKAYSVQLAALYVLMLRCGMARGVLAEDYVRVLVQKLELVSRQVEDVLKYEKKVKNDCLSLIESPNLFFIGRGIDYALSMEGSIKLKEISYIHSEAYAAGELKHGTISLITAGVPCIALATQENLHSKMVSNIREVKSRGAMVILITNEDFPEYEDLYDLRFNLPLCDPMFSPFLSVVYLQMIAYYVSYGKGLDVDHPRNLAKSVTVE